MNQPECRQDDASQQHKDSRESGLETLTTEQVKRMQERLQRLEEETKQQKEHSQRLEEENEQQKEHSQRLEEENKGLRTLPSMENTYQLTEENPSGRRKRRCVKYSMPKLELNAQVDPHNGKLKHKQDDVTIVRTDAWKDVAGITIPTHLRVKENAMAYPIPSALGTKASDGMGMSGSSLTYVNEACVQDFVKAQVEDAVKALGLGKLLRVHVEMSIFSCVPDVVVVSLKQVPLLFIEVKSPERYRKEGEVFDSKVIAIQIFRYLMASKKIGNEVPIVCLSTYNKLEIATATDLTNDSRHREFLHNTMKELSTITLMTDIPEDVQGISCKEDVAPSPTNGTVKLVDRPKNKASKDDRDEDMKIFTSKVFGDDGQSGQIMQALLAALRASYHYNKNHGDEEDAEKLQVVAEGDDLGGIFTPRFSEEGMKWTTIRQGVKASYRDFPQDRKNPKYYLLARIGQGSCGKVHLASTTTGAMCAIKLYIPRRSTQYSNEERDKEERKRLEQKEKERDEEGGRWSKLYPDLKIRTLKINHLPALMMVYGGQLDPSERKKHLPYIRKELERFAKEGYAYKSSDLRWRHVVFHNNRILLVDLESLEDISAQTDTQKSSLVEAQVDRLERRSGSDARETMNHALF